MRVFGTLFLFILFLMLSGCASLPLFKPSAEAESVTSSSESPQSEDPVPTEEGGATAETDEAREEALRALPEGTVVIEKEEPGFLAKWWASATSVFQKKKPEAPVASAPLWIGTIKVVNQSERYVLIDSKLTVALPPGETLNSVGNDFESGTVQTTADRVHPFFIADITSGNPAVGDRVYSPK